MPLGIYDTAVLNGVVANLKRPQTALLEMFFPMVNASTTEEVYFDVAIGKRRIAPFVHSTLAGKMVEGLGFQTNSFKPAYIKDLRVFDPRRGVKRQVGEPIAGGASPASRVQALLVQEMVDQGEMAQRRYETMASEALRTGKVTIKGEGFDTVVVDFLRNPAHTVTLTGASRWGQAGIVPLDDIRTWASTVLQNEGAMVKSVIMDTAAWDLFIADPKTEKQMDFRRIDQPNIQRLINGTILGLEFHGTLGGQDYWTYQDWYVDPDTDLEVPMMPANTVIMASAQLQGVRHFGAIMDEEILFAAQESFTKSWVEKNPSTRQLLRQTAPLIVPERANASFAATVN